MRQYYVLLGKCIVGDVHEWHKCLSWTLDFGF